MAEPNRSWTYIPPAWSGTQVEGTSFLPIGRYKMPDGSEQVSFGLPQPMLDAVRAVGFASGREQDPAAPQGYVSQNALMKGGQGLAESAMVGGIAAPKPRNALGMFAGRNAKTADVGALKKAESLAASGADRGQIWQETGWFQGPDGKWRFEIDDSGAQFTRPQQEKFLDGGNIEGGSAFVFRHPELWKAYPEAAATKMQIKRDSRPGTYEGWFSEQANQIGGTASTIGSARPMALHEIQHNIQRLENFSRGKSPDRGWSKDALNAQAKEIYERPRQKIADEDKELLKELGLWDGPLNSGERKPWADLTDRERMEYWENARYELYRKSGGEVEARAVEARRDLAPDQRRARPPWLDYDVPESDILAVNAMFDPAKSDSANLLAANPMAGAVPLAWRQPQEQQQGPMMGEQMGRRIPPEEEAQRQALIRYLERVQN